MNVGFVRIAAVYASSIERPLCRLRHAGSLRPHRWDHGTRRPAGGEAISRRTKEALAAAKALGVKLGNPNGAALRRAGERGAALWEAVQQNADDHAKALSPVVQALKAEGHTTLRVMAEALNDRVMMTRRGGRWHVSNVRNLLARLATQSEGSLTTSGHLSNTQLADAMKV